MNILKSKYLALIVLAVSTVISSCKKDNDDNTDPVLENAKLTIDLSLLVGTQNLVLNSNTYTNSVGEQYTVSRFKFYLSNVQLIRSNNNVVDLDDTYFLIDASDQSSTTLTINDIPDGSFTGMKFIIGVDSARNVSGAQTGALAPSDMFWTWNSGYIFCKLEGTSPSVPLNDFQFHIGGFKQPNNAIRQVELDFASDSFTSAKGEHPEIHVVVDLEEFFKNPIDHSLAVVNNVTMPGPAAMAIADNYADMIIFDHIHHGN